MLHSNSYNNGLPRDLRDAYASRDHAFFHAQIECLAKELLENGTNEDVLMRLHVALALHDSLTNAGETVSLMTDYINL